MTKNLEIHQFAAKIRRMTDEQIYHEVHPNLKFIEEVMRCNYEGLLSVLAPHFDNDTMAKIEGVLNNWYYGEIREGGIYCPLTKEEEEK